MKPTALHSVSEAGTRPYVWRCPVCAVPARISAQYGSMRRSMRRTSFRKSIAANISAALRGSALARSRRKRFPRGAGKCSGKRKNVILSLASVKYEGIRCIEGDIDQRLQNHQWIEKPHTMCSINAQCGDLFNVHFVILPGRETNVSGPQMRFTLPVRLEICSVRSFCLFSDFL